MSSKTILRRQVMIKPMYLDKNINEHLLNMLKEEPGDRISAFDALQHNFFKT